METIIGGSKTSHRGIALALAVASIVATSSIASAQAVRPISEWTTEKPATLAEIEAALEKHRGESFTWVSWGAAYNNGFRQVLAPLARKYDLKITEDSPIKKPLVRVQSESGNITWHALLGLDAGGAISLGEVGALEELDSRVIDKRDYLPVAGKLPWVAAAGGTWGSVLVYSTNTVKTKWGGREPQTAADIFNPAKFPGDRMFMDQGGSGWKYILRFAALSAEPALLTDEAGRAQIAKLTDQRIDRAFAELKTLKPSIKAWWQNSSECPAAIAAGEVDICQVSTGNLALAVKSGVGIKACWTCGIIVASDWGAVTGGLKKKDPTKFELVQLVLAWISFPENSQLALAEAVTYSPLTSAGSKMLEAAAFDRTRGFLVTAPDKINKAVLMDEVWTGRINDKMIERFNRWLQGSE